MIVFMVFGGFAVDSANAWRMRAQLQATADAAAHAAVIDLPDETAAVQTANDFAAANMAESEHGDVLAVADVQVGSWDPAARAFTEAEDNGGVGVVTGPTPPVDAVRVVTRRDAGNANRLRTSFLRLIGMDGWNVSAEAVAQRYFPKCQGKDRIFARNIIDLQSNNLFKDGICLHAQKHVEVNNNNVWEPGVSVTMPFMDDIVTSNSDWDTHNPGLADALGEEWFDMKIVDEVWNIIWAFADPASPYQPGYVGVDRFGNAIPQDEILITIDFQDFQDITPDPGHIYFLACDRPDRKVDLGKREQPYEKVVIVSQCRIRTDQDTTFEDVVIAGVATDDPDDETHPMSINIGQANRLGKADNCAPGGGVMLFAKGGIKSSTMLQAHGLQAVAGTDINLTPHLNGLEGVNLIAGHDVSIVSNQAFGSVCPNLDEIAVPHYRLVL